MKLHIITQVIAVLIMLYFGVLVKEQGMIFLMWIILALCVFAIVWMINDANK